MNFRGLGLPPSYYAEFANLLSIATDGASTCISRNDGYCWMKGPCSDYPDLWDYTFKVEFQYAAAYLRIPIATFAATEKAITDGEDICSVYVEYLPADSLEMTQDLSIVFGSMFFQSFSMYAHQKPISQVIPTNLVLYVNENALSTAYIGNDDTTQGTNIFKPMTQSLNITKTHSDYTNMEGFPCIEANISGSYRDLNATKNCYYMDF